MSEEQIMKMLNCFPQIEVVKYILNLQEENAGLRTILKGTTHCYDEEEHQRLNNVLTEYEIWLEETINKLKQSQLEITKLNIPNYSKAINIKEFNIRITTNSICLDKLQELKKEGKK